MRVLICGGREGVPQELLDEALDDLARYWPHSTNYAHGAARGVDTQSEVWARKRGHSYRAYPIDPTEDGDDPQIAPTNRNKRMYHLFRPEVCVGVNGGRGTNHMMEHCRQHGVRVIDIDVDDDGYHFHFWKH